MIFDILPFELAVRGSLCLVVSRNVIPTESGDHMFKTEISGGELLRCRNEKISLENQAKQICMVSIKGLVVCKSPPAGYIVGYLRDVQGGLCGGWEALIRILLMN